MSDISHCNHSVNKFTMNIIQKQVSDMRGFDVHKTNAKRSFKMLDTSFQSPGGKSITDRFEYFA